MLDSLFPTGWSSFLIGGLMIGVGVGLMFMMFGRVVGLSTFFTSSWSWLSKKPYFHQSTFIDSRSWRLWCAIGLVCGAFIWKILFGAEFNADTSVSPILLVIGGMLVGYGSRLSNGCTSGHGICGLSSLSLPSLGAVAIFMAMAIGTAHLVTYFFGS